MKRQLLKGMTMVMLVVALALVTAVVSANGQSRGGVRANVPFEFIVGDKTIAAGDCRIDNASDSGQALIIRNAAAQDSAVRLISQLGGESKQAKLVFHRYGQRYFLVEVWAGEGNHGVALLKSKNERGIERELAMTRGTKETAQARYERIEVLATQR